ncbi:hypothetical protein GCM10023194_81240 [Planotetraspora phitsanulokensis]|uniref:Uncharacterized protein n=1 Tax=Planotetraspora phitsanulokensis TaxID=575192 RepID=A0A8J3UCV6_9ACTN|nr:hypothetical protein [Planotetraspora phitsanulokensis]GII42893.1 hypothetical protein Pph01_78960 [Planotetraspora phitsanulokensis]
MTATVPPPYEMWEAARQARATTTHVLDALAFSATDTAAPHLTATWDELLQQATDYIYRDAADTAAMNAEGSGLDLDNGVTYDDLPPLIAGQVQVHALVAATLFANRDPIAAW